MFTYQVIIAPSVMVGFAKEHIEASFSAGLSAGQRIEKKKYPVSVKRLPLFLHTL